MPAWPRPSRLDHRLLADVPVSRGCTCPYNYVNAGCDYRRSRSRRHSLSGHTTPQLRYIERWRHFLAPGCNGSHHLIDLDERRPAISYINETAGLVDTHVLLTAANMEPNRIAAFALWPGGSASVNTPAICCILALTIILGHHPNPAWKPTAGSYCRDGSNGSSSLDSQIDCRQWRPPVAPANWERIPSWSPPPNAQHHRRLTSARKRFRTILGLMERFCNMAFQLAHSGFAAQTADSARCFPRSCAC